MAETKGGSRRTAHRNSGTGRFITKKQAERRDPRTWERERIRTGGKKKGS